MHLTKLKERKKKGVRCKKKINIEIAITESEDGRWCCYYRRSLGRKHSRRRHTSVELIIVSSIVIDAKLCPIIKRWIRSLNDITRSSCRPIAMELSTKLRKYSASLCRRGLITNLIKSKFQHW